jgi:peroxiredoxin
MPAHIVIIFFFGLYSVCKKELCSVRDNIAWYNNIKCKSGCISEGVLQTLAKFKEYQQLHFPQGERLQ